MICSVTLRYQTHISPIPNWICYAQLGISDPQLGMIFTNGDNILNWGYRLLVLYSSPVMAPTILTSAICDFIMWILVSLLGLFGTCYYQHTTPPHKVIYHTSTPRNLLHTHTGNSSFIKGIWSLGSLGSFSKNKCRLKVDFFQKGLTPPTQTFRTFGTLSRKVS